MSAKFPRGGGGSRTFLARSLLNFFVDLLLLCEYHCVLVSFSLCAMDWSVICGCSMPCACPSAHYFLSLSLDFIIHSFGPVIG